MKHKVLLIEDDDSFYEAMRLSLLDYPVEIVWAPDGRAGIRSFQQARDAAARFSAVIIDYVLPDMKGSEVCRHLRRLDPEQEILFASGHQDPDFLTDILETGSSGFLFKGRPPAEWRERLLRSLDQYEKKTRVIGLDNYSPDRAELEMRQAGIIGRSKALYKVFKEAERYSASPYRTLIVGETGVGKELIARALVPPGKNLVAINCAAFRDNEGLMESQLFGHVKGAFTNADRDSAGLVMQAHNNVLFLDELHHLSISAQAKLYRFLQEMKFRRVGDGTGRESLGLRTQETSNSNIIYLYGTGRSDRKPIGRNFIKCLWDLNSDQKLNPAMTFLPFSGKGSLTKNEFLDALPLETNKKLRVLAPINFFSDGFLDLLKRAAWQTGAEIEYHLVPGPEWNAAFDDPKAAEKFDYILSAYAASERYPTVQLRYLAGNQDEAPVDLKKAEFSESSAEQEKILRDYQLWLLHSKLVVPLFFNRTLFIFQKNIDIGDQSSTDAEIELWRVKGRAP